MPPYNRIHSEYFMYILLGGLALALLVWLATWSRSLTARARPEVVHSFGPPDDPVTEGNRPVPLFLLVLFGLVLLWAIGYTVYSGTNYPY